MSTPRPLAVVLAGPNGAGKSSTATRLLRGALAVDEFVNVDTIAAGLSAYRPESAAITAGRVMLDRVRFLAHQRRDFAFETTLAGRRHARWLRALRTTGFHIHMIFLSLPTPDLAIARVRERVRRGGHSVPESVVRRRFAAGLKNFFGLYQAVVDGWHLYDNSDFSGPRLIALRTAVAAIVVVDRPAWNHLQELA